MIASRQGPAAKTSRRRLLRGGLALGLVGGGCTRAAWAQTAPRTKVEIITASGNFSLFQIKLLEQLHLFEKYGVDVGIQNVSDSAKILAALLGGDADICPGSGYNQLFPAISKGAKIKVLAGAALAPLSILYSSRPSIRSVKDLPGHTVGTDQVGALLNQLTVAVLEKYNVDRTKVRFVNIGSEGNIFKALAAGTIDAGVGPIEYRDTAAKYNLAPLVDGQFWKELPLYPNQAMYASDTAIAGKRNGLVRVMAAYAEMFRWITKPENKSAFLRYYEQTLPNASDEEAAFLQDFLGKPGVLATNLVLDEQQIRFVQDLNVELGRQTAALPFARCADMSLAHEALQLVNT